MKPSTAKNQTLNKINSLIENFSVDDSKEKLLLLNKIKIGIEQAESGKTKTTSEVKKSLKKYLSRTSSRKIYTKK